MTEMAIGGGDLDLEFLAHPQPQYKLLRDVAPVVELGAAMGGMISVSGDAEVRHVLQHPESDRVHPVSTTP